MLGALDKNAMTEVERGILLTLHPIDSPTDRRVAELGFLASLLAKIPPQRGLRASYIEREEYDRLRPNDAPLSARLVERYDSWRAACWHATSLLPDGRWLGPGRPWTAARAGERRRRAYTRQEVLDSIRLCELELRRQPSSSDYFRWLRAKRRNTRLTGQSIRLAGLTALYRHFPAENGGWNAALHAARERRCRSSSSTETSLKLYLGQRASAVRVRDDGSTSP